MPEKKERQKSKEDDSVLTDIEINSDSKSPGESGESNQKILNSIGGLKYGSRGDGLLQCHETETTSFQGAISGQESKNRIEAIQSEVSSLEENQS
jgi:hypothetical protein